MVPNIAYSLDEFKMCAQEEHDDQEYGVLLFNEAIPEEVEHFNEPPRVHPMDFIFACILHVCIGNAHT